jgi:hypothetical protein
MKYAIEIDSDAVIYIPRFIKFVSGIQKLLGGDTSTDTDTQTAWRSHKPTFIFLKLG